MAPYEMWRGRKLIVTYFYVLGSTYYLFKDHAYQGNFDTLKPKTRMAPYEMRRGRKLIMTNFYVLRSTYYLFKDHAYQGNFNVQSDDASSSDIPTIARHFGRSISNKLLWGRLTCLLKMSRLMISL
ncbi:hypothetical protein ES332_D11G228100v1 [Gossypium tomentosum]|uniref:Uncharacterized protein n=1 Tax=Gossypium tomentosum TaxID=34277 RepID=A0A5D2IS08_GOSTO|nr:hypothetical protein ES332_D11G228100v1 [Gossypium tomentosum]